MVTFLSAPFFIYHLLCFLLLKIPLLLLLLLLKLLATLYITSFLLNFFNYFCKTNIVRINLTFYTPPIPKIILLFVLLLFFLLRYFLTELLMVTYISLLSLLNIAYYYCQCLLDKIFKYVHFLPPSILISFYILILTYPFILNFYILILCKIKKKYRIACTSFLLKSKFL